MNERIPLDQKRKEYLTRLREGIKRRYNFCRIVGDTKDSGNMKAMKDTSSFLLKVITNGYYKRSSANKLNEVAQTYHFLIKK